jgi:aryl-alcohol dehydrogenase-like predicted oxidoreductase
MMICKELAKTGITLPELALGTWQYQGGVEPLGANVIDTAESYGTEGVVRQAIQGIRHKVFLATKVSPRHFRRPDIIRAAEQSLKRLKTDYIDLYQLHWPNYTVPVGETMAAMEELVETGKIRFIGVSNFSASEIEKAQATLSKNRIVSNQVRYNLVDRTIEHGLLQYCEAKQITVLAFSPLANGLAGCGKTRFEAGAVPRNSLVSTAQPDKKKACAEKTSNSWTCSATSAPSSEFRSITPCALFVS